MKIPLKLCKSLILNFILIQSLFAFSFKFGTETYEGVLKVGKTQSQIVYLGEESGDLAVFCFKNNSVVGRKILANCKNGKLCKFTGNINWKGCNVIPEASASGTIISIKSVKRIFNKKP